MKWFRTACVSVVFLAIAKAPMAQVSDQSLHAKIDYIFAAWDRRDSPGCALAVIRDGTMIYKAAYGMADLDHDVPIDLETVFQVGSLSKQFTAAAIVMMAQDGKLSLDDDARKYLPELPDFGTRI